MYNIKGYPDAYQVQLDISCMPATIKEMERVMANPDIGEEEVFLRSTFFRLHR
jgi:small subunit ribosomal protein S6